MGESGNDSSDREDAIKPKKQGLIAIALKRVTTMAKGAPKGNSSVPRGVATMVAAAQEGRRQQPNKGGSSGPIRAAVVVQ